jgi:hypothetical protein
MERHYAQGLLLKILRFLLYGPLPYLFNCSFSTGVVPDQFKLASVIPSYKKFSKSVVSNYGAISLLSVFKKILEKLMYERPVVFLEKNQVIFQGHFGFRSNHSTTHGCHLTLIPDKIKKAVDLQNKMYSCGIFLFDTVNLTISL